MSLGESVESKDDDTEPTPENETTPTKMCSACGKKSDAVKKCTSCKCVWYCDKKCQKKHRKEHKIELKDPQALQNMATHYSNGKFGLPVDQAKCIELLHKATDLGFPPAQFQLGNFHDGGRMGLEQNKEEASKCYKEAAKGGDVIARHHLGCKEARNGDIVAAMRHFRLSASGGFRKSMEGLTACFEDGLLHHADLAETLQAFYRARAEMKSEDRDQCIKHLKEIGEYKEEYEM